MGSKLAIAVIALCACTGQPDIVVEQASVLAHWQQDGTIWWHPDPELDLYFGPPAGTDSDCHVLADDVVATLNGAPVMLDHGGLVPDPNHPDTNRVECSGPKLQLPLTAVAGAPFDLVIADATAEIHLSVVDPFATRSITLDGGGALVPGTMATVRWAPETDDVENLTYNGIPKPYDFSALDCTPPIFPGPGLSTDNGTLIKNGNAFTFAVPSTNGQHYTLACTLAVFIYATISACDFASCKVSLRLPGAYDFPFTLTI